MRSNSLNTVAAQGCGTQVYWSLHWHAPCTPDLANLAAAYGYGYGYDLAKNHPFVAIELFLILNGRALQASDADCVLTMLAVASGEMDEAALADWVRCHTSAL
jgi:death-on-curing protein